jgi:hypothetical protein
MIMAGLIETIFRDWLKENLLPPSQNVASPKHERFGSSPRETLIGLDCRIDYLDKSKEVWRGIIKTPIRGCDAGKRKNKFHFILSQAMNFLANGPAG